MMVIFLAFSSTQLLSCVWLFAAPWTAACQASLSFTNSWALFKLMFIESVMPSNQLILCYPLLLLPSIFSQHQGLYRWVSSLHQVDEVLEFQLRHQSFALVCNEYSGLISFKIDWLDLLAIQGTLKSPLQHHSSRGSILGCSAFFIVQLIHPFMTTRKAIALNKQNFIDKIMSLLCNMLSRLVITFLPRSKHLLIS